MADFQSDDPAADRPLLGPELPNVRRAFPPLLQTLRYFLEGEEKAISVMRAEFEIVRTWRDAGRAIGV